MGNGAEFDVFLCHNSEDKEAVIDIAEQLERSGLRPWLDEWELRPGLSWQYALEQQISKIATAAVFVGESGLGPWQKQEIYAFLNEFVSRGCPVIPVILANAPKRDELPIFLKSNTWVDFRRQRPDPMERLIWGITGKKPSRQQVQTARESRAERHKPKDSRSKTVQVEPPRPSPAEVELISAVGVDYVKLRDLLTAGKWKEADEETRHVMLVVAKREKEGWLDPASIENFPCEDLKTIDQLWVQHSNGRFGFSVQKKIWEEVGGRSEADYDVWCRFCDRIQWRLKGKWVSYTDLTFRTSDPIGHLPSWVGVDARNMYIVEIVRDRGRITRGNTRELYSVFFSRAKNCNL